MRQRADLVREFDDRFVATSRLSHAQALALFEAMWEEARQLGVLPGDPWEGLEVDLRIARILSTCSPSS
jgi:hypothetical protein